MLYRNMCEMLGSAAGEKWFLLLDLGQRLRDFLVQVFASTQYTRVRIASGGAGLGPGGGGGTATSASSSRPITSCMTQDAARSGPSTEPTPATAPEAIDEEATHVTPAGNTDSAPREAPGASGAASVPPKVGTIETPEGSRPPPGTDGENESEMRPVEFELQLPAGFSVLAEELVQSAAQLVQLVVHNRAVYSEFYTQILNAYLGRVGLAAAPSAR